MQGLHRFLVTAHQMNVIERWNNRPNLLPETVAAHSFLVAVVGWGMAASGEHAGDDAVEVLKRAVAHDLHEVITGDILAPTKRLTRTIERAVERLERRAGRELVKQLPEGVRERFEPYVVDPMDDTGEGRLVAKADVLAASLKAWFEVQMGNQFHRDNLDRIRRSLLDASDPHVAELMWELEVHGETPPSPPSLSTFLRVLFTLYYVRRWNNLPALASKSVAAYSHLVALIAWVLAETENALHGAALPVGDVLRRALLLEAPKAITGDILYVSRKATKTMERGVETARSRAVRELVEMLPDRLQEAFAPYLEPLPGKAERLVEDASLLAGYLEARMEARLGNAYFQPILESLRRRLDTPFATTRRVLAALEASDDDVPLAEGS